MLMHMTHQHKCIVHMTANRRLLLAFPDTFPAMGSWVLCQPFPRCSGCKDAILLFREIAQTTMLVMFCSQRYSTECAI